MYELIWIGINKLKITFKIIAGRIITATAANYDGAAGTLNIADLSQRVATLGAQDAWLLQVGAVILALAFLTKGAMWPLGFWLPTTYASASAPVAAMLVLMTKLKKLY